MTCNPTIPGVAHEIFAARKEFRNWGCPRYRAREDSVPLESSLFGFGGRFEVEAEEFGAVALERRPDLAAEERREVFAPLPCGRGAEAVGSQGQAIIERVARQGFARFGVDQRHAEGAERAAVDLLDRTPYVTAVLPLDAR